MTISEETDQVFKGVSGDVVIDDAGNNRKLTVSNTDGWTDTVVWNPYGNEGQIGSLQSPPARPPTHPAVRRMAT